MLSSEGKVLGTFASYYREARSPTKTDVQLIENASHIAGIAIERHLKEDELRRSEARKAAILDLRHFDRIVTIDHEGHITEFNPAVAERTFGYRRDDVLGKPLVDVIIPPSLRDKHRDGFLRYLTTGEAQVLGKHIEMRAMRADGSELLVELRNSRRSPWRGRRRSPVTCETSRNANGQKKSCGAVMHFSPKRSASVRPAAFPGVSTLTK